MKTTVISFYSDIEGSTYYSDCAKALRQDCDRLGIPHDVRELPSSNDYRLNCLKKPQFILDVLQERKEPVLWLDCDSTIISPIDRVDQLISCDVGFAVSYGVHFPKGFLDWISERMVSDALTKGGAIQVIPDIPINFMGPMASPILFNYTPDAVSLLEFWVEMSARDIDTADHDVLALQVFPSIPSRLPNIKIGVIPAWFSSPDHMAIVCRCSSVGQAHWKKIGRSTIDERLALMERRGA